MKKYNFLNRILQIMIVLFGISFLTFLLTYMAPGNPVRAMYAASGTIPGEQILEQTRESLGLNEPFLTQYVNWLANCFHGDFGTSYSYSRPVLDLMLARLWPTLQLALGSLVLMLAVAVPIGILYPGLCYGGKVYQTGADSFSGGTEPGLCYRCQMQGNTGTCDLMETCAAQFHSSPMEVLPGERIGKESLHPYTQALMGAVFDLHMDFDEPIKSIEGEAPSPLNIPEGCPFQNRCRQCMEICRKIKPALKNISEDHQVACHLYERKNCFFHRNPL